MLKCVGLYKKVLSLKMEILRPCHSSSCTEGDKQIMGSFIICSVSFTEYVSVNSAKRVIWAAPVQRVQKWLIHARCCRQPEGTRLHEVTSDTLQDNVAKFLREIGWAEWIKCCWLKIRPWAWHHFSARPDRLCGTLRLSSCGHWLLFFVGAWSWPFDLYLLQRLLSTVLTFVGLSSDKP